jgi:hypothetical protein
VVSGLLGSVFSFGDDLKKRLRGLLHDPIGSASAEVGAFNDKAQSAARGLLSGQDSGGMQSVNALGAGPHALGGLLGAIKVFHGSPHVFDKADSSKIGTGEGAQAYGHGLYWAENPEVAKDYQRVLSGNKNARFDGKAFKITADDSGKKLAVHADGIADDFRGGVPYSEELASGFATVDDAIAFVKKQSGADGLNMYDIERRAISKAPTTEQLLSGDPLRVSPTGNLYEANLRWPDAAREAKDPLGPQHFLDWDAYYADLPKSQQQALKKAGGNVASYWPNAQKVGDVMPRTSQGAALLAQQGIPGVAYMDAGSRAAGQGTRNYVTFDDALVELLSRNGLPLK